MRIIVGDIKVMRLRSLGRSKLEVSIESRHVVRMIGLVKGVALIAASVGQAASATEHHTCRKAHHAAAPNRVLQLHGSSGSSRRGMRPVDGTRPACTVRPS